MNRTDRLRAKIAANREKLADDYRAGQIARAAHYERERKVNADIIADLFGA